MLLLPGIGKYTARSICANAFGQPAAVLDTNVARIVERFFGLQGERVKSPCKILWLAAEALNHSLDASLMAASPILQEGISPTGFVPNDFCNYFHLLARDSRIRFREAVGYPRRFIFLSQAPLNQ